MHCRDASFFVMSAATWDKLKHLVQFAVPKVQERPRLDGCLRSAVVGEPWHACPKSVFMKRAYEVAKVQSPAAYAAAERRAAWAAAAVAVETSGHRGGLERCSTIGVGYIPFVSSSCFRVEAAYLARLKQ